MQRSACFRSLVVLSSDFLYPICLQGAPSLPSVFINGIQVPPSSITLKTNSCLTVQQPASSLSLSVGVRLCTAVVVVIDASVDYQLAVNIFFPLLIFDRSCLFSAWSQRHQPCLAIARQLRCRRARLHRLLPSALAAGSGNWFYYNKYYFQLSSVFCFQF